MAIHKVRESVFDSITSAHQGGNPMGAEAVRQQIGAWLDGGDTVEIVADNESEDVVG